MLNCKHRYSRIRMENLYVYVHVEILRSFIKIRITRKVGNFFRLFLWFLERFIREVEWPKLVHRWIFTTNSRQITLLSCNWIWTKYYSYGKIASSIRFDLLEFPILRKNRIYNVSDWIFYGKWIDLFEKINLFMARFS